MVARHQTGPQPCDNILSLKWTMEILQLLELMTHNVVCGVWRRVYHNNDAITLLTESEMESVHLSLFTVIE